MTFGENVMTLHMAV